MQYKLNANLLDISCIIKICLLITFVHFLYASDNFIVVNTHELTHFMGIPFSIVSYAALCIFCIVCLLENFFLKEQIFKCRRVLIIFWLLYCVGIFFSDMVTGASVLNLTSPVLIPVLYLIIFPRLNFPLHLLSIAIAANAIWLIVTSVSIVDVYFPLYKGIYRNSNSFGIMVVGAVFSSLYAYVVVKNKFIKFTWLTVTALFVTFVILSGSRTCIISAVGLLTGYCVLSKIHDKISTRVSKKRFIIYAILLWCSLLLFVIFPQEVIDFLGSIIFKWNASGDITSGRAARWADSINAFKWFGNGSDPPLGLHNSFLHTLYQYGIFATIFFLLFYMLSVYYAMLDWLKYKSRRSMYALLAIISVCFMACFEEGFGIMFGYPTNVFVFTLIGKLVYRKYFEENYIYGYQ